MAFIPDTPKQSGFTPDPEQVGEILPVTGQENYRVGYDLGAPSNFQNFAARQLGAEPEYVDTKSSALPIHQRMAYGFMPDWTEKQRYLAKRFGPDNVKTVEDRGEKRHFVYADAMWKPVDEVGMSFSDMSVDMMQYIPQTAGEVAVAIGTAGQPWPRLIRLVAPAVSGMVVGLTQDSLARGGKPTQSDVVRRGMEATAEIGAEIPLGIAARAISPKKADPIVNAFRDAQERLKAQGMEVGADAAKIRNPLLKQRVVANDKLIETFTDIQQKLIGDERIPVQAEIQALAGDIIDGSARLVRDMENRSIRVDAGIRKGLERITQERLTALAPLKPQTVRRTGMDMRAGIAQQHDAAQLEIGNLFARNATTAREQGIAVPVDQLDDIFGDIAATSGLPAKDTGELLAAFAPSLARKWSQRPSKSLRDKKMKEAAESALEGVDDDGIEITELGWEQVYNLRKTMREDIQYGMKGEMGGVSQPALKNIDKKLTAVLEDGATRGGFLDSFNEANRLFRERVAPLRSGALWNAQKNRGMPGFVDDYNVGASLIDGKKAIDNIETVRLAWGGGGTPPFIKAAQSEVRNRISRGALKSDGTIDLLQIKQNIKNLDRNVLKSLYGNRSGDMLKRIDSLGRLAQASYHGRHIDPALLDSYLTAETQTGAVQLLNRIKREQVNRVADQKAMSSVVEYVLKSGDASNVDPYRLADHMWSLSSREAEKFMGAIKNSGQRAAVEAAFVRSFFDRNKSLRSDIAQQALISGNEVLFDPKSALAVFGKTENVRLMETVLGKQRVQNLKDISVAYGAAVRGSSMGKDQVLLKFTPYARMGADGLNPRIMAALANAKEIVWSKGGNTSEFADNLWAAAVGTTEGVIAIAEEADRDPDFKEWFTSAFRSAENERRITPSTWLAK